MPIFSSVGSLSFIKPLESQSSFWIASYIPLDKMLPINGFLYANNLYIGSIKTTSGNIQAPYLLELENANYEIPNQGFINGFIDTKNANVTSINFDNNSNLIYLTGAGNIGTGGYSITRQFDTNGNLLLEYVDPPSSGTNYRYPISTVITNNNSLTSLGLHRVSSVDRTYINNYTGNTRNFAKFVSNIGSTAKLNLTLDDNYYFGNGSVILHLDTNVSNVLLTKVLTSNLSVPIIGNTEIDVSDSNNFFVSSRTGTLSGNGIITNSLIKYDNNGNIIWQKENNITNASINGMFLELLTSDSNNIIAAGASFHGNGLSNNKSIISFDQNGNENWQLKMTFLGTGQYSNTTIGALTSIKLLENSLYIFGTSEGAGNNDVGYVLKIPSDGQIIGSGNYTLFSNIGNFNGNLNLILESGNLSFADGNTISFSNHVVTINNDSTANITSSNITSNITQTWSYRSTQLF